jgi:hypothetical protein
VVEVGDGWELFPAVFLFASNDGIKPETKDSRSLCAIFQEL